MGLYGPVRLLRRQPLAILAVLALADTAMTRDKLAFLLWDRVPQAQARKRLRTVLSQLRKALERTGVADALLITPQTVALSHHHCQVDVWNFSRLVQQARRARGAAAITLCEQALSLYVGPLLDGFTLSGAPEFECWLTVECNHLAELYQKTLSVLVNAYMVNGNSEQAIAAAKQLLTVDPLHEETHRTLMRLYAITGRRHAALEQYKCCLDILTSELAIDPLPETRALYETLLHGQALPCPTTAIPTWRMHPSLDVPCVGRSQELSRLQQTLLDGLAGRPTIACVYGPAGIGKTRLIREATQQVPAATWIGGGQGMDQAIPYVAVLGAIRTALTHLIARTDGDNGRLQLKLSRIWLAEASRVLPEIQLHYPDLRPPPALPPEQSQARLFEALTRLVIALAQASGGAVLVLDDLDEADTTSLAWLANLIHHLPRVQLGIVLAYRRDKNNPSLDKLLECLSRSGMRHDIPLAAFSPDTIASLLHQVNIPATSIPDLATRLWEKTGGIPLFVLETLRVLLEENAGLFSVPSGPLPLPSTVQDVIQARIRLLDNVTQQVLDTCAVLTANFDFDLVWAVSGRDEAEAAWALDTLVARRILVREGDQYCFVHTHITEVAMTRIGAARCRLLHRRAAEALRVHLPAASAQVAHHLEEAGRYAEAAALWLTTSQKAWQLAAADNALVACARGLVLAQEPDLRFALLAQREDILHHLGHRQEQAELLAEMARLADHLAAGQRSKVAYRQGRRLLALNQWAEAETTLRQAVSQITPEDDALLVLLAKALAQQQKRTEAQSVAHQALSLATKRKDIDAQINILLTLAEIAGAGEDLDAMETYLQQAASQAQVIADPAIEANLNYYKGRLAFWRRKFDTALAYAQKTAGLYQAQANREGEAKSCVLVAMSLSRMGHHEEALTAYTRARQHYRAIQHTQGLAAATINAAVAASRLARLEQMATLSREAFRLFESIGDDRGICAAANNLAAALLWMGQAAEAEPWLRLALERAKALNIRLQQAGASANLGESLLMQGRVEEARQAIEQGLALRRQLNDVDICVDIASLAIVCLRAGDLAEADRLSDQAVTEVKAHPEGVDHPHQVFFARAQVLRALKRTDKAQASLAQARDRLEQVLATFPSPADRERYLQAFVFNRNLLAALKDNRWPDPPRLV